MIKDATTLLRRHYNALSVCNAVRLVQTNQQRCFVTQAKVIWRYMNCVHFGFETLWGVMAEYLTSRWTLIPELMVNDELPPEGWVAYPGVRSLCEVFSIHLKIGNPQISLTGAQSLNELRGGKPLWYIWKSSMREFHLCVSDNQIKLTYQTGSPHKGL